MIHCWTMPDELVRYSLRKRRISMSRIVHVVVGAFAFVGVVSTALSLGRWCMSIGSSMSRLMVISMVLPAILHTILISCIGQVVISIVPLSRCIVNRRLRISSSMTRWWMRVIRHPMPFLIRTENNPI